MDFLAEFSPSPDETFDKLMGAVVNLCIRVYTLYEMTKNFAVSSMSTWMSQATQTQTWPGFRSCGSGIIRNTAASTFGRTTGSLSRNEEVLFEVPPFVEARRHREFPNRTVFRGASRLKRWIFVVCEDWTDGEIRYLKPVTAFEPSEGVTYWERYR